jgi:peroxiredoxin-like protein
MMKELPHHYRLEARAVGEGPVVLSVNGLTPLDSAPPAEFGGPGDLWSPETLLLGAVADCYVLSFRVIASNSSLEWNELHCEAEGEVDREENALRFTQIRLRATLTLSPGQKTDRAERMLERAKKSCLVTNSLSTPVELETEIREAAP